MKRTLSLLALVIAVLSLNSCWPLIAGAGAVVGYQFRDSGYQVHPPVTRD